MTASRSIFTYDADADAIAFAYLLPHHRAITMLLTGQ